MYLLLADTFMAKSKETFNKKEKEKKRLKQRQAKKEKMDERKASGPRSMDDMMAYIDEDGNITSTPPDPKKKKVFNADDMQISVPKYEPGEEETVRKGVVSFFNEAKGFGFIIDELSGERIFVHVNQMTERITENNKVVFEVEKGDRGLNAINVKKLV